MKVKKRKGSRLSYIWEFIKSAPRVLKYKLFKIAPKHNKIGKYKQITMNESIVVLQTEIQRGKPFAAIRFGGTEISAFNGYEKKRFGFARKYSKNVRYALKNNGGFFPTDDENIDNYGEYLLDILSGTTLLGISGLHMENYFFKYYCPSAKPVQNWAFDPILGRWSHLLEGKRVLVISPLAEQIEEQYKKRKLLFGEDSNILPEFTLITIKAVQTIAKETDERFSNWFEALDYMKVQILKHEFDIALVGAGAYGTPLCLFINSLNKQAIQSGGATQLLFGIIGKRWEKRDYVSRYINEHWQRPNLKPKGAHYVVNVCYW